MDLKKIITNMFFPQECIFCKTEIPITTECPLCEKCKNIFVFSSKQIFQRYPLEAIVSCVKYEQAARAAVIKFKYGQRKDVGRFFAEVMTQKLKQHNVSPTIVTFIPTRKNERKRFNQSEFLAKKIARSLKIPCKPLLIKKRATKSQTSCKTVIQRKRNVRGAFCPRKNNLSLQNEKILIADDVFTTGATMTECAKALINAGATCIYGISFALTATGETHKEIRFEFSQKPEIITYENLPYDAARLLKKHIRAKRQKGRYNPIDRFFRSEKNN